MPVVAVLTLDSERSQLARLLTESGYLAVAISPKPVREGQLGPLIAALACDFAVADVDAAVGIDPALVDLWHLVSSAQMPRAIAIAGLAPGRADFDDLAVLVQRILEDEAVPTRLPVFDDAETSVASLDLATWKLHTATGLTETESGHRDVGGGARSELLVALATVVAEDDQALMMLETASQYDEPDSPVGLVTMGMPTVGVPLDDQLDVSAEVTAGCADGVLVPIVAVTMEAGWLEDVRRWASAVTSRPEDRLVLRDINGLPAVEDLTVVLASKGHELLVRAGRASIRQGPALLTAPGVGHDNMASPFRAWPTYVGQPVAAGEQCWRVHSEIHAESGDAVMPSHIWVAPLPFD
jgi:hypothetical protein